jgi:endo-1,4-beta-mannosidase
MTFELGVNYWPSRNAMYMWREPDMGEVRAEMAQIADIGFDVVRIFTLTQDFLPRAATVDATMVARLLQVVRAAKDAGLKIIPTLVVINMSGRMWWPEWMLDSSGKPRDLFTEPTILASQVLLAETVARAVGGDDSIRAFDLANEIDDAQRPPSRAAGHGWASALANAIRSAAPGIPIQIGAHLPSLTTDNMRVDDIASVADENVMHAYPLYSDVARSFLDTDLVPFSCALTTALAGNDRPTLMQEFGLCTAPPGFTGQTITDDFLGQQRKQYLASEDEQATYYADVLEKLADTGASGAYAWCYGDYDSSLFNRPPFATALRERTFGLVRADASEKPAAEVFRRFRNRRDAGELAQPADDAFRVLDITPDEFYRAPADNFARLYGRWLARDGVAEIAAEDASRR